MNKKDLINFINNEYSANLNNINTSYSNINAAKNVWWLNISTNKFINTVNILLCSDNSVYWISIPPNQMLKLDSNFKIRLDKDVVDLEISADKNFKFLIDIKSGGTEFNFKNYIVQTITLPGTSL